MLNALIIVMIIVHGLFFVFESFYWGRPFTNKAFKQTAADAYAMRVMAFNQGFYNLFIVLALLIGLVFAHKIGFEVQAQTLVDYGAASAFGAGIVLWYSEPKLYQAAIVQALPGLLYGVLRFLG